MKCKLCNKECEPQCHDNRELCLPCRRIEIGKSMGRIKGFCIDCGEPLRKIDIDICFTCTLDRIREREKQERIRNFVN